MPCEDFVRLVEENMYILNRLSDRLKAWNNLSSRHSRQQLSTVMRLYFGGPAKLKDIARREGVTAPSLCATFRKLESSGMIKRRIDDRDRRNTWYAVTSEGEVLALRLLEKFREGISMFFSKLPPQDEKLMMSALRNMNDVLKRMEKNNA
jgi:DNA-binding MarR family transcriptional regulator